MTVLYIGGDRHIRSVRLDFDSENRPQLTSLDKIDIGEMPSFLSFSQRGGWLAAIAEGDDRLVTLRVADDGSLSEISSRPCGGGPAYVSQARRAVLTASYGSGETRVYPVDEQGALSEQISCIATGKYSHCAVESKKQPYVFVPSKGTDSICILAREDSGKLVEVARQKTPEGSGPRHLVFSPDGEKAYVSCENDCSLLVYRVTGSDLVQLNRVTSLPRPQKEGDTRV